MASHKLGITSEWRMYKPYEEPSPWRKNIILDAGLHDWLSSFQGLEYSPTTSDMLYTHIAVGNGNTPAVKTDLALDNETYRRAIASEYSTTADTSDPYNPFIILGIKIPTTEAMMVISEVGLRKEVMDNGYFFNRFLPTNVFGIPASVIKLPDEELVVQCKITLSNPAQVVQSSVELTDPHDEDYSEIRTVSSVKLLAGIEDIFSKNFGSPDVMVCSLGTSSTLPTASDSGVNTAIDHLSNVTTITRDVSITSTGASITKEIGFTDEYGYDVINGSSVSEFAIIGGGFDMHSSWTPAYVIDGYMVKFLSVYSKLEFTR